MRLPRTVLRAALPAALILSGIGLPVAAGQRTGRLTVSVQVVDSCAASTAAGGGASQACVGAAAPIAILREAHRATAAAQPQSGTAIGRVQDAPGLVTVIY